MDEYTVNLNSTSLRSLFSLIQNKNTLMQLSKSLGVGYGTVRKWKAGTTLIPNSIFCKIVKIYHLNKKSFKYKLSISKKHRTGKLKEWILLQKNKEIRAKATNTLYRKYGMNYFRKIGLISAEKGYLTKRELEIHKINKTLPRLLQPKSHFTINNANYDLVYFKNNKPTFAEEVLGSRKKKSSILFQIAKIQEKCENLRFPVIVTSWYEQKFNTKTERFPIESVLWMLETNSLIPILLDVKTFFDFRIGLLSNNFISSKEYLREKLKRDTC